MPEMDDSLFNDKKEPAKEQHLDDSMFNDAHEEPVNEVTEVIRTVPAKHDVGSGTARVLGELSMVPGAPGAASAIKAAYDTATTPERKWGDVLNLYRAYRKNASMADTQAQAQHPGAYLSGSLPVGVLLGLANPAGAIAKTATSSPQLVNLASNAGNALALRASQEPLPESAGDIGQSALNVASKASGDVLAGIAMQKGMEALASPRDTLKRIATAPQRAVDWAANKIGDSSMARSLAGKPSPIPDSQSSDRVKQLRSIMDASEMGSDVSAAVSGSLRDLGGLAGKPVSALTPNEIRDVAQKLDDVIKIRGAYGTSPEMHVAGWDKLLASHGIAPDATVSQLLRAVGNARDASYVASLAGGVAQRNAGIGIPSQVQPVQNMFDAAKQARAEYLLGNINRAGQPNKGYSGKYQFQLSELDDIAAGKASPRDIAALKLAKAAQEGRAQIGSDFQSVPRDLAGVVADTAAAAHDESSILNKLPNWSTEGPTAAAQAEMAALASPESEMLMQALPEDVAAKIGGMTPDQRVAEAVGLRQRLAGFNRDATAEREMSLDALFARARELQGTLKTIEDAKFEAGQDASRKAALDEMAKTASSELERITRGREAIRKMLGIGAGATTLASTGSPTAAMLAYGAGNRALQGADILGAVGQKIGQGSMSVTQMMEQAKQLAARDDATGRAARWALGGDLSSIPGRLAVLFRRLPQAEEQLSASR